MRFPTAAVLALLLAGPAFAVPAPVEGTTVSSSPSPIALELVEAAYPKEVFPAFQPNFAADSEKGMKQSGRFDRLEKLFPGFTHRFSIEAAAEVRKILETRLPELHKKLAAIYDAELTAAEMHEYLDFVKSPAGQALMHAIATHQDIQSMTAVVARDGRMTEHAADQQLAIASMGAAASISGPDLVEIRRFVESPTGKRAAAADAKALSVIVAFANSPDPNQVKRLDALALKIVRDLSSKPVRK
jgi:hypothetical protein